MKKDFDKEVQSILDTYSDEVKEKSDAILKECAKDCAKECREKARQLFNGKKYYKGFTTKVVSNDQYDFEIVVHNKTYPGLTHLLENGHAVKPTPKRAGKKTRVAGKAHMKPAAEKYTEEAVRRMESEL